MKCFSRAIFYRFRYLRRSFNFDYFYSGKVGRKVCQKEFYAFERTLNFLRSKFFLSLYKVAVNTQC